MVNGENSAGGRGITPKISISLLRAGAAVITLGDHVWDQKEIVPYMETEPRLLRPLACDGGAESPALAYPPPSPPPSSSSFPVPIEAIPTSSPS